MKVSLLFLLFLQCSILFAQNTIKRLDDSKISSTRLTKKMQHLVDSAHIVGLSMVIINNNKIVYENTFGTKDKRTHEKLDNQTVMYAASLTKPLFAYAFLQLIDQKIFNLDTPVYRYLKKPVAEYDKWKDLANEPNFNKITARMLLSHSSGLPVVRFIYGNRLTLLAPPGEKFYYSNEGMNLLGFVVEEYTGKTLETIIKESVYDKLNMTQTGMVWHPEFDKNFAFGYDMKGELIGAEKRTSARAAGSMVTTAHDYAQFIMQTIKQAGLSQNLYKQMLAPQIYLKNLRGFGPARDSLTTQNDAIKLAWGLGWGMFQSKHGQAYFHAGNSEGWKNYCVVYPNKKMAVIILSNSDKIEAQFGKIIHMAIKDNQSPMQWLGIHDDKQ